MSPSILLEDIEAFKMQADVVPFRNTIYQVLEFISIEITTSMGTTLVRIKSYIKAYVNFVHIYIVEENIY